MSLPAETQVLIVGAGPSGMASAITLASLGLQVTIVDALPTHKYGARATLVHPRTLEELDTAGLAKPLLDIGIHSKGVIFYGGVQELLQVHVTHLHDTTKFPLMLCIAQHDVEKVFRERLAAMHIELFRNINVVGMREAPSGRGVEVSFENGESICAHYVVGADGSRSTIRRLMGIDFQDPETGVPYEINNRPTASMQWIFADVYIAEPTPQSLRRDIVSWYLNGLVLFCPLSSREKEDPDSAPASFWRLVMIVRQGAPDPPRRPDLAYLQGEVDVRKPWADKMTLTSVTASGVYFVRSAVASTFFKKLGTGNVLLVGDAAHVHAPTGGQGMNLGLCDAIALGRAIRAHVDASKGDEQLMKFAVSRQFTARRVIGMVKRTTLFINLPTGWKRALRNMVVWFAGSLPFVRKLAAWRISGLIHRTA